MTTEDKITNDEMLRLMSCKSYDDWAAACKDIKAAHGGQYPNDWYALVIQSGLMDQIMGAGSSKISVIIPTKAP
jgi:hypothetical protein